MLGDFLVFATFFKLEQKFHSCYNEQSKNLCTNIFLDDIIDIMSPGGEKRITR